MKKSSSVAIQSSIDELFLEDSDEENKENVKALINENESLRKGMHEILDSIRNQDCKFKLNWFFRMLNLFLKRLIFQALA